MKLFIAGTDTNIGKTYISVGLLKAFHQRGLSTIGMKPLASGCQQIQNKLYNDDALLLQKTASISLDYEKINPFLFAEFAAPHLAAKKVGRLLNVEQLITQSHFALNHSADIHLIEGIGGWYVPLNQQETMADFVKHQQFAVILVIGIRLGCLNHGILTYKAMQQDKINLIGWIANCIEDDMPFCEENISTLEHWIAAPLLGTVKYNENPEEKINMQTLIINFRRH
ncbi:MAG: dethiobiotin synthase [Gammaproteobacteria bacterium]|nr:dethiobiotin synthase [Gammaproteobacteria bacterium]